MFYFSNVNGFTVFFPPPFFPPSLLPSCPPTLSFSLYFFPGQIQIIGTRVAERDWPAPVRREAGPWNLPRRLATVQCAMTMPQATIMESGPARAVRPSSREVFKVIVCWKRHIPFLILRGEASEEGKRIISYLYKTLKPSRFSSISGRNVEKRQELRRRNGQMPGQWWLSNYASFIW